MTPTPQQKRIIDADVKIGESLKVDARAGTGKTSTLIALSLSRPNSRMLYICFNNKGAAEANQRFSEAGARNVKASTVHSLAWEVKAEYEKAGKFQTRIHLKEIQRKLECTHAFAWRVQNTIRTFCESADLELGPQHCACKKDPSGSGAEAEAERAVLNTMRTGLLASARIIWDATVDLKDPFPISFDGYLKVYHIRGAKLPYEYILLDEAQDSNPITFAIVREQRGTAKVILIGDNCQQIYSWRGAHNAMRFWDSEHYFPLTESFRFGKNIAGLSNIILATFQKAKHLTTGLRPVDSLGIIPPTERYTLLARTNAKLYEAAITCAAMGKKVHFVGTKAENNWDPSVPYRFNDALDAFKLYTNRKSEILNPYFRNFENYKELEAIATGKIEGENEQGETIQGDRELEALCRLIDKHKLQLPILLQQIVAASVAPENAAMLFSTAHRSKGLEWLRVKLADDFTPLLIREKEETEKGESLLPPRLSIPGEDADFDEYNLIYVAITRAIERLEVNANIQDLLDNPHLIAEPLQETAKSLVFTSSKSYVPTAEVAPPKREPALRIPFAEKDPAKELANTHGGRLLWQPLDKTWKWSHPMDAPLPEPLKKYLTA